MEFSWSQVAAFRLQRHHLAQRHSSDLVQICRDICGVQAQVMGAARLALRARASNLTRQDVHSALWEKRLLVKTSAMRQTLHLLAADDYYIYLTALRPSRMEAMMRIMARIDVGQKQVEAMTAVLMSFLADDPVPQRELVEQVKPHISKKLQASMKLFWNGWPLFRPAMIEGLICYGPDQGRETTFVRAESWLPRASRPEESEAKEFLLRRYLSAYGPATLRDFSKWSGIPMKEAKPIWDSLQEELIEVSMEGTKAFILRDNLRKLEAAELSQPMVRLLPSFDPYMLAHADKDHLVHPRFYKRVYRNQGWLSPVILLDGRVVGLWSREQEGSQCMVRTELFEKLPKKVLAAIEAESERIIQFTAA
ncbi:MAG TPA: winged helix DNA-binding domain-containing protein [Candidatus Angelobacter sp.]